MFVFHFEGEEGQVDVLAGRRLDDPVTVFLVVVVVVTVLGVRVEVFDIVRGLQMPATN